MPVASGRGNAKHLQCPYHAWTYDLRGRLLRAPFIEGRDDADKYNVRFRGFRSRQAELLEMRRDVP